MMVNEACDQEFQDKEVIFFMTGVNTYSLKMKSGISGNNSYMTLIHVAPNNSIKALHLLSYVTRSLITSLGQVLTSLIPLI